MFDDVPEPVWKTSIGNWSSSSPAAMRSAAAAMRSALVGIEKAELAVHARCGGLDPAEPARDGNRDRLAGDGEVGNGLARLGAPELLGWDAVSVTALTLAGDAHAAVGEDACSGGEASRRLLDRRPADVRAAGHSSLCSTRRLPQFRHSTM